MFSDFRHHDLFPSQLQAAGPCGNKEEAELLELLTRPFVKSLLTVHDTVKARSYESPLPSYDPNFHPQDGTRHRKKGIEYRTVGLHKSANEPLVGVVTGDRGCGQLGLCTCKCMGVNQC